MLEELLEGSMPGIRSGKGLNAMLDGVTLVLVLHAAATVAIAGLIWFVQVVHYPLFERVGDTTFSEYEAWHSRLTSLVVVPLMLTEAGTAIVLTAWLPGEPLLWWGISLLVVVWLSTFLLQAPQHRRLGSGFDAAAHRRLVNTNWLRTIAWTVRGAIALGLLTTAF